MLVYTPKGNILVVGNYLHQCNLLLDHPTYPFELQRLNYHYFNPHGPPEGFNRPESMTMIQPRWQTTSSKSVEVQRSQVDDLFKTSKDGDGLAETEPCECCH